MPAQGYPGRIGATPERSSSDSNRRRRESFAPYGVIPPDEGDGNPTADLVFRCDDGWVNFIGHTLDEIEVRDGRLRCELLNRHDTHTQTLMPMTGDALVVVAPGRGRLLPTRALRRGQGVRACRSTRCVHLHRGTWHWGPYPVGAADRARLQHPGRGDTPTDNGVVALARDHGVVFEVAP